MIKLFEAPGSVDYAHEAAKLLEWAGAMLDSPEYAGAVEFRMAGMATRAALEFHLHEMASGLPVFGRWHNFAIRLLKAGKLTFADYRQLRRLARIGAKAVHGKPFEYDRARAFLAAVNAFVEKTTTLTETA